VIIAEFHFLMGRKRKKQNGFFRPEDGHSQDGHTSESMYVTGEFLKSSGENISRNEVREGGSDNFQPF